jgi:hypothetical protein
MYTRALTRLSVVVPGYLFRTVSRWVRSEDTHLDLVFHCISLRNSSVAPPELSMLSCSDAADESWATELMTYQIISVFLE